MALHPAGNVISQIIEGEAVVINLDNGCYFTFNASGTDIWAGVESGADVDGIVDLLQRRYRIPSHDALGATCQFIETLDREGLVVDDGLGGVAVVADLDPAAPFDDPSMQKFEDMQDLILLDPVHEVDDQQGWPHRREDALAPNHKL